MKKYRSQSVAWLFAALCSFSLLPLQATSAFADGLVETDLRVESPILGRSINYSVYRPAADPRPGEKWPVLYLLHGFGGNHGDWLKLGNIAATLDRGMAAGKVRPMMIVMPSAGNSWYVDDLRPNGFGSIAKAMTRDLIAAIDQNYPTARCREGRAIAGISMGGYGALLYAFEHPEIFKTVVSLSGSVFYETPSDEAERGASLDKRFNGVFGEPFSWKTYQQWSVFPRVEKLKERGDKPAVWLSAGDDDYPSILAGNIELHLALRKHGFKTELRIDNARHNWSYWSEAIAPALEWLSPNMSASCAANATVSASAHSGKPATP